jgi:hypothetical protein
MHGRHEPFRRPTSPPTPADVRRIAAIADPVIRNLEVTHCYWRLAVAFAARSGEGANWCTYATWASRQAGRTIRGEDLLDHLRRRLGERQWMLHPAATLWRRLLGRGLFRPATRLGRLTGELHTPFDAFELASACVARGNLKVFEEIGFVFARYLELCPPNGAARTGWFERFLDGLRPGDPPDGQRYLRQAFARYEHGRLERDPKRRAELALLANLEVGFHEQTRLQPEISEALDAADATSKDLGGRALEALFPSAPRWWAALRRPAAAAVGVFAAGADQAARRLARQVITDSLMVLSVPGRVLPLGTHLSDPFPQTLREPTDAELIELLARFEPIPPAPDDCGARDWSELHQRMHYIVHLFRALHLSTELTRPPFTQQQVESFSRGLLPSGEL